MSRAYPPIPLTELRSLVRIVRRLRKDCPWDREQTHRSLRGSLIEETYEVVEALDRADMKELKKELGDVLLHVFMQATIAEQRKEFSLKDVLNDISAKLIRRHPHVFGGTSVADSSEVRHRWETLKLQEGRTSLLEGVPKGMPALQRALRIQQRAAKVGFDWEKRKDVWKKVREELEELRDTLEVSDRRRREEEFGDLLFALVNYARFVDVDPEAALRATIEKFNSRFRHIERRMRKEGKDIRRATLQEMDGMWEDAKRKQRGNAKGKRKKAKM